MDWTSKTHFQWDWETLALFNGEDTEIAKPAEEPKSKIESGIDFCTGSAYSTAMVVFSSSEVGNCSSKSSISTHFDSPSKAMTITPEINFTSAEGYPNDQNKYRNVARVDNSENSPNVISAEGAKEPVIGLKLGRRTYFEDPCVGNNSKSSSPSRTISSNTFVKKSRVYQQSMLSTYCQVEGCNVDLSTAKDYHRKHRVCETHSKSPRVVVAGQERRFCQQCSRFHSLSEFDQKKRSCRRRLYDHNARRRKPQLKTFSFNSSKLPPPYYDDKRHTNLEFDQAPLSQMTTRASSIWDSPGTFKLIQTDSSGIKPSKIGGIDGQLHFPSNCDPDSFPTICDDMGKLLPLKSTPSGVHNQGLEASVGFNLDGAQDLRRVLSLLSTDSRTPNLEPPSSVQFVYAANNTDAAHHPATHPFHAATMGLWQVEQPTAQVLPFNSRGNGGSLQESPLLKALYGTTGFYDSGRLGWHPPL